jgi:hypothetical protein
MSDAPVSTPEEATPVAAPESTAAAAPEAEKPAVPAKPAEPFNTDLLQSCTARFSYKAWRLYHNSRKDSDFLLTAPVRATVNARSIEGGEELASLLKDAGASEMLRKGNTLSFTTTFAIIQTVIKHPQLLLLDAVRI